MTRSPSVQQDIESFHQFASAAVSRGGDVTIDDLYEQIFRELLTYMIEDTRNISRALSGRKSHLGTHSRGRALRAQNQNSCSFASIRV